MPSNDWHVACDNNACCHEHCQKQNMQPTTNVCIETKMSKKGDCYVERMSSVLNSSRFNARRNSLLHYSSSEIDDFSCCFGQPKKRMKNVLLEAIFVSERSNLMAFVHKCMYACVQYMYRGNASVENCYTGMRNGNNGSDSIHKGWGR